MGQSGHPTLGEENAAPICFWSLILCCDLLYQQLWTALVLLATGDGLEPVDNRMQRQARKLKQARGMATHSQPVRQGQPDCAAAVEAAAVLGSGTWCHSALHQGCHDGLLETSLSFLCKGIGISFNPQQRGTLYWVLLLPLLAPNWKLHLVRFQSSPAHPSISGQSAAAGVLSRVGRALGMDD